MHENMDSEGGLGPMDSGEPTADILQAYDVVCIAGKGRGSETWTVQARDLYDAIGQARRLVGIGEVKIQQDGHQLCFLHLVTPTRWWVEVNESRKSQK